MGRSILQRSPTDSVPVLLHVIRCREFLEEFRVGNKERKKEMKERTL